VQVLADSKTDEHIERIQKILQEQKMLLESLQKERIQDGNHTK